MLQTPQQAQHKHFNTRLNELEATSRQPNHPTSPLRYQHTFLIDTFYSSEGYDGGEKIRVTRDEKSGEVKECLRKIRLGNLDVYSPKWNADWRVSVNIEVPGNVHPFSVLSSFLLTVDKQFRPLSEQQLSRAERIGCLTRTKNSLLTLPRSPRPQVVTK